MGSEPQATGQPMAEPFAALPDRGKMAGLTLHLLCHTRTNKT
jgi:hypothetical protein